MSTEAYLPLTPKQFHILLALAGAPQNGYRISISAQKNSKGRVRLSPATMYTNLHRLVEQRLVEEVTDDSDVRSDGRGQRFWTLTDLGVRVLRAEAEHLAADAEMALALGGRNGS